MIVVGVDGSRESVAALRFAVREAHLRGCDVKAVGVWHVPSAVYGGDFAAVVPNPADFEQAVADGLAQALVATRREAEGVRVQTVLREGDAAHVLLEESEGAELLVVGCRNVGFLGRLLHPSVSGHCSRDAHCPVTIVHAD